MEENNKDGVNTPDNKQEILKIEDNIKSYVDTKIIDILTRIENMSFNKQEEKKEKEKEVDNLNELLKD